MKKFYFLFVLPVFIGCGLPVLAQNDSSSLDLGSVRLQKQFTQQITIKGEALEKMPFANLAEAINVWLYGAYSNPTSLVYIVDGNVVADVNAWSIYDIEEIVLVQSALVQVSGNTGMQQLVLVTTRGGHKKSLSPLPVDGHPQRSFSFRAAGQTALLNRDYEHVAGANGAGSSTNFYHQYYVSAAYTHGKVNAGLSASWLQDAFPAEKSDTVKVATPFHFNRYRFTGFFNAAIGRRSQLSVTVAAAPERAPLEYSTTTSANMVSNDNFKEHQFIVTPYLRFRTNLGRGLQNNFSAAWQTFNSRAGLEENNLFAQSSGNSEQHSQATEKADASALVLRDNISLTRQVHQWTITPALNLQYVYEKTSDVVNSVTTIPDPAGGLSGGLMVAYSTYGHTGKGHLFSATPSISVSYRDLLSAGGGGFAYLPMPGAVPKAAFFPFGHVAIDLLKLHDDASKNSLLVFGSVARSYSNSYTAGQLDDFTGSGSTGITPPPGVGFYGTVTGGVYTPVPAPDNNAALYAAHTVWTTGATLRLAGPSASPGEAKLVLGYNFEKRDFAAPQPVPVFIPGTSIYYMHNPLLQSYSHRFNLGTTIKLGPSFQWQPGITLTNIHITGDTPPYSVEGYSPGDFTPFHSWTGGWVNRIRISRFFAGLDLLYHFNTYEGTIYTSTISYQYARENSVDLQNVYAGYTFRAGKTHDMELYLNSRNLLENSASDLTDRRRYYGAGFKAAF